MKKISFTEKTFNFFKNFQCNFYKKIVIFEEVSSTNTKAKELASNNEVEGTIVISKKQLEGRGRNNRVWQSPEGGLYLSIILRPTVNTKVTLIPLLGALSIVKTLDSMKLNSSIKWPNDVRIKNKKVSGVLIESESTGEKLEYIILGIGVNLKSDILDFPKEILNKTTSIENEIHNNTDYYEFLEELLMNINEYYIQFKNRKYEFILNQWRKNSDTIGKNVKIKTKDDEIFGEVLDIDSSGYLIIKTESGSIRTITSGDCQYLEEI